MVLRFYSSFAFKLQISKGILWGMDGHHGEYMIGSLVSLDRSSKSSVDRNGNG